jgi:hypothetical protein
MDDSNDKNVTIEQSGAKVERTKHVGGGVILLHVLEYFALQFIPVFAIGIIIFVSSKVAINFEALIENILIVCVVSNATSVQSNFASKSENKERALAKLLMFGRVFIICIGSILYSLFLIDELVEGYDIGINYLMALVPTGAIFIITFIIAYASIADGGEI